MVFPHVGKPQVTSTRKETKTMKLHLRSALAIGALTGGLVTGGALVANAATSTSTPSTTTSREQVDRAQVDQVRVHRPEAVLRRILRDRPARHHPVARVAHRRARPSTARTWVRHQARARARARAPARHRAAQHLRRARPLPWGNASEAAREGSVVPREAPSSAGSFTTSAATCRGWGAPGGSEDIGVPLRCALRWPRWWRRVPSDGLSTTGRPPKCPRSEKHLSACRPGGEWLLLDILGVVRRRTAQPRARASSASTLRYMTESARRRADGAYVGHQGCECVVIERLRRPVEGECTAFVVDGCGGNSGFDQLDPAGGPRRCGPPKP